MTEQKQSAEQAKAIKLEDAALDTAAGGYNPKEIGVDKVVPWKSGSGPKSVYQHNQTDLEF